jgi:hypothetical protein
MKNMTLFSVLGWEQRFIESINHILKKNGINSICLICYTDYLEMNNMKANLQKIEKISKEKNIEFIKIELKYDNSVNNWRILDDFFKKRNFNNVLLNITTFPRETIWTFMFFLRNQISELKYIYYKPKSYDNSEGGLTKNHKSPRLLFKHSGVFDIDKKLAIFIIPGFDRNRMDLLVEHYEPSKVIYLSQIGKQFENMTRNCGISSKTSYANIDIENIGIDSYNIDDTFNKLNDLIKAHSNYNIIVTSLGPKTSAISTYLAYLKNNDLALAYVPAREFSGEYSIGFDENPVFGNIKFK